MQKLLMAFFWDATLAVSAGTFKIEGITDKKQIRCICMLSIILFCCIFSACAAPKEDGFITDWLVSGPYPNYQVDGQGQALDTDFLKGEADSVPFPGLKAKSEFGVDMANLIANMEGTNEWGFRETKTLDTTWQKKSSSDFKVCFDGMFRPIDDYFAVYSVCWIESPDKRKIKLGVGSDDDHKIFLNGKLVGRHYGAQGTYPDQFTYDAELQPGLNRLMFKLVDRTCGADFCLRLTDANKKPMNDLKFYTDNPARKYGAELYQNGYAGNLFFETPNLFTGEQKLTISVFSDKNDKYSLRLNGKSVTTGTATINLRNGKNLLKLEVIANGKTVAVLQKEVTAYSKEVLTAENESMREKIKKNAEMISAMEKKQKALEQELDIVMQKRKEAYTGVEKKYFEQHMAAIANAPKSIDVPMMPATLRSKLCINGEWEASVDRKNWSEIVLPFKMMSKFFYCWRLPMKLKDPAKRWGEVVPLQGWNDFKIHPVVSAKESWFRKNFTFNGEGVATFIADCFIGKLKVFVNSKESGTYAGWMGKVEIPLKNLKTGKNVLELNYEHDRMLGNNACLNRSVGDKRGFVGDIYLEFSSPVKMSDVWVKTSWRKATLDVTSEIKNSTNQEQKAEIHQYVTKDGRVKLVLPSVTEALPPHQTVTFKNAVKWADPLLWGIGGQYGNPDMYDLVSDVYVDGKSVDRYVQSFGFREFWIHVTDFYLNGKRIFLQGDSGVLNLDNIKKRDIQYSLLRHDGINILRYHDSPLWSGAAAEAGDQRGMLSYVQMYPILFKDIKAEHHGGKTVPFNEWTKTEEHQYNLDNYRRWFRLFRNNPSVVIWSTDNEIFTQGRLQQYNIDFNIRNDKIAALYGQFMKTLDPALVITRDGDVGTWSHRGPWFETPPCDTANYHYPEFNSEKQILNWQETYDYRPVIFGETLYHAYGTWYKSIGAIPDAVNKRAAFVRQVAGLYKALEVPGAIFMGLTPDGFICFDNTGKGNPWGVTASMYEQYKKDGLIPPALKADQYPYYRIPWPAYSGKGIKDIAANIVAREWGGARGINWFDPSRPSHVRNAVNDAYKETLRPQPPLRIPDEGECIILTKPNTVVWSVSDAGTRYGVQADKNGKAWFQLPKSGQYTFECDGIARSIDVPSRKSYAAKPGFDQIKTFELK